MNHDLSCQWALTVDPRDWQREALAAWQSGGQRGIVSVVTGAGKTVLAESCILEFLHRFPAGRILIVVPTLALLDQWYVSLREDLDVPTYQLATYSGEGRSEEPAKVNLLVVNTARSLSNELSQGADTLLIVDEVHRVATPENAKALRGRWQATLGMSATPERQYDSNLEAFVLPILGPIIYRYSYVRAVRDGVVSRFELINVRVELSLEEQSEYDALTRRIGVLLARLKRGDDVEESLRRSLQKRSSIGASARMRVPAAIRLAELHHGARTLIFHERIDSAEAIFKGLEQRGASATIYHSRIGPVLRRDNLRLFRKGAFDALVTCRALDEGVNVPETTVAIVASSTASTRQRIQRLGRVLRPAPGKELATVFTIFATDVERRRLQNEVEAGVGADSITWMQVGAKSRG